MGGATGDDDDGDNNGDGFIHFYVGYSIPHKCTYKHHLFFFRAFSHPPPFSFTHHPRGHWTPRIEQMLTEKVRLLVSSIPNNIVSLQQLSFNKASITHDRHSSLYSDHLNIKNPVLRFDDKSSRIVLY